MNCTETQSNFSAYLDGAVTGIEMQSIAAHLHTCAACNTEFAALQSTQRALQSLGPARVPADLSLRLRVAISQQLNRRTLADRLSLSWQNTMRPLAVRTAAGLACALLLVGGTIALLGVVTPPDAVLADDTPLGAMTAPHYLYSAVQRAPIVTQHDTVLVIQASINEQGQVYDYEILSGPQDPIVRSQVSEQLLQSVFQPAQVFGKPIHGQVLLTFSGISVRG